MPSKWNLLPVKNFQHKYDSYHSTNNDPRIGTQLAMQCLTEKVKSK